jgi:hypothetical protein
LFARGPKQTKNHGDYGYLIQWRGHEVDISRQVAALKKKGIVHANALEAEPRERILHWAYNLVLPAYEKVLARGDEQPQAVRDTAELPYGKSDMKLAVLLGIMFHEASLLARSGHLDRLYLAYTRLADFQRTEGAERDGQGRWTPDSPAQQKYLAAVGDEYAKLTRELQEFCAWLGI